MTREKAIYVINEHIVHWKHLKVNGCANQSEAKRTLEAFDMAIKALQTESCEDAISRQQSIDAVCRWGVDNERNKKLMITMAEAKQSIVDLLDDLPPVQPWQKMGHWIIVDDCEQFIAKCSECGRIEDSRMISKYPYCHCGANMQEVEK